MSTTLDISIVETDNLTFDYDKKLGFQLIDKELQMMPRSITDVIKDYYVNGEKEESDKMNDAILNHMTYMNGDNFTESLDLEQRMYLQAQILPNPYI
jgi:hypothetical protein